MLVAVIGPAPAPIVIAQQRTLFQCDKYSTYTVETSTSYYESIYMYCDIYAQGYVSYFQICLKSPLFLSLQPLYTTAIQSHSSAILVSTQSHGSLHSA